VKNRVTQILDVKYPFVLGPMRQITLGEMAGAVSNSGGFGQIAASGLLADRLRDEIKKAGELTNRPYGLNIALHRSNALEALEIAVEMGVRTITTSGGNPTKIMERAKAAGIKVLHKVSTTTMGLKAQDAGVDGVIAMGFEAGGHGGREQITTLCLVPQMVDVLDIPVVASGGIGDARGVAAVFALGAEGVEIGTRFLATNECPVPEYFKKSVLAAKDNGTVVLGIDSMPLRVLRNRAAESIVNPDKAREDTAKGVDYLAPSDEADNSIMPSGQVAGLIRQIKPISDIFPELLIGAGEICAKLHSFFKEEAL